MDTARTRVLMIVAAIVPAALVLFVVVRYTIPADTLDDHNDVASAIFAGLGVILGVMLGQLVVAGWNDYQAVRMASFREAAALRNIVRLADGFSPIQRETILRLTDEYARSVVEDEWPIAPHGNAPGHRAENAIHDLFRFLADVDMQAERASPYLDAAIHKLGELSDARAERLAAIRSHLPGLMWGVLIVEAVLVVAFVPFFGVEGYLVHGALTLVLAVAVFLLLALVWVLDNPFQPPSGIAPDEFDDIVRLVRRELESDREAAALLEEPQD